MDDCEKFLAQQKPWVRAVLTGDYAAPGILPALKEDKGFETLETARDEYEKLLKRCRTHYPEYRKREAKRARESALRQLPASPVGRPRQDDFAREALALATLGLSQPKIAQELNLRYPKRKDRKGNLSPFTDEAVRKMLKRSWGSNRTKP